MDNEFEEALRCFRFYDSENKGYNEFQLLEKMLNSLSYSITPDEISLHINRLKKKGGKYLLYEDFKEILQ